MIGIETFVENVERVLERDIESNVEQYSIVTSELEKCSKVVAGPGSGKTTVIVLRILKLVYVDGLDPSEIMATTFTKKAASELKSRILKWAYLLNVALIKSGKLDANDLSRIKRLNFDAIVCGTIDSIAESVLTDYRQEDQNPPIMIEDFVAKQFISRPIIFDKEKRDAVSSELLENKLADKYKFGLNKMLSVLLELYNRMMENEIPLDSISNKTPNIAEVLIAYHNRLSERKLMDFVNLENNFLSFINSDYSCEFIGKLKVLLVDEYQDTNLLQEKIYFSIGKQLVRKTGSMMVVGDDDQSLYRFRGSRVHLFTDIEKRAAPFGINFETSFLLTNYRSSDTIVKFCNDYITLDSSYQDVRVSDKPIMKQGRHDSENYPIFGIFRDNVEDLGRDIAKIVSDYVNCGSYTFVDKNGDSWIFENPGTGNASDAVLLCSSSANTQNSSGIPRLPACVREAFSLGGSNIKVFNPRGSELYAVGAVEEICGILLECIDPGSVVQNSKDMRLTKDVSDVLVKWRQKAIPLIQKREYSNHKLSDFVKAWNTGKPYNAAKWDKKYVSVIDIINKILAWLPEIRNDAEGLVFLQAITNTINKSTIVDNKEINLDFDEKTHLPKLPSVKKIYYNIIVPLANGTIDIEEDLLFSVSVQDRFNIMTIHQSKGLEFPITFVDVASDFKATPWKQEFKRFPNRNDSTTSYELFLSEYSDELRTDRSPRDRQFDEMIRKYFVAFSRTQDILILVGLTPNLDLKKTIPNVATGWDRDENWVWSGLKNIKMLR